MRTRGIRIVLGIALAISGVVGCSAPAPEQTASAGCSVPTELDRTVLPIAEPAPPDLQGARCAERETAGAVRGQGARTARPTS